MSRTRVLLALLAFWLPASASAQTGPAATPEHTAAELRQAILACAATAQAQRAACYERLAASLREPPPAASRTPAPGDDASSQRITLAPGESRSIGNWHVRSEVDALTDRVRIIMSVSGQGERTALRSPMLFLRCYSGRMEAFISVDQFIGTADNIPARLRFGQEEMRREMWSSSTSGDAAFSRSAQDFVRRLTTAPRLIYEVEGWRGQTFRGSFETADFASLAHLLAPCMPQPRPAQANPPRPAQPANPQPR